MRREHIDPRYTRHGVVNPHMTVPHLFSAELVVAVPVKCAPQRLQVSVRDTMRPLLELAADARLELVKGDKVGAVAVDFFKELVP